MTTLKQAIETGKISINPTAVPKEGVLPPIPTAPFKAKLIDSKTGEEVAITPVLRTPERLAKLDALYGAITGPELPPVGSMPYGPGEGLPPVNVTVGQPQPIQYLANPNSQASLNTIAGVKIDDDIPIEDPKTRYQTVMDALKVGQSFSLPIELKSALINRWIREKSKDKSFKLDIRRTEDVNEWRIWRTK
jgi:hypothetical protein